MAAMLFFFKQDSVELWSFDQSSRLVEVNVDGNSNRIPLYLHTNNSEFEFGEFARKKFKERDLNAFGDYWRVTAQSKDTINIYGNPVEKKKALSIYLKKILDKLSKNLNVDRVILVFEPCASNDIREEQISFIVKNLIGVEIISIPYFLLFGKFQSTINSSAFDEMINFRSYYGDLYLYHIQKGELIKSEVFEGFGLDPRLKSILSYLIKEIRNEGSYLSEQEIREIIKDDAVEVLAKMENGLIDHKFTDELDVSFKLFVHKSAFTGYIESSGSNLFLVDSVRSFLDKSNCKNCVKYISTPELNVKEFYDPLGLSHLKTESSSFNEDFLKFILSNISQLIQYNDVNRNPPKRDISESSETKKQSVNVIIDEEEPPKIEESADPDKVLDEAEVLMKDAKWESAVLKLEHFLKLSPNDRYGTKKLDEAKKNFEHLENINSLYDQGDKLMASKSYGAAIDIWELILKVKPGDRYGKGELQSAKELFEKQKNEKPNGGPKVPPPPPQRPSAPPKPVAKKAAPKTPPKPPAPPKDPPKPAVKAAPKPPGPPKPPPAPPRPPKPVAKKVIPKPPGPPKPPPPPPKPPSPKGKSGPPDLPKPPPLKK